MACISTTAIGSATFRLSLIHISKDKTNMESAKRFHEAMKNSKLVIVEASGHEVNKDNPNELVRVLQDFWAER